MLYTNLKHVESEAQFKELIENNEKVMICCGRMGPMCLPVYDLMENLETKYTEVQFRDMAFDSPVSMVIRRLPEVRTFTSLPFTVYFRDGKVVRATGGLQSKAQVKEILDRDLA